MQRMSQAHLITDLIGPVLLESVILAQIAPFYPSLHSRGYIL